MRRLIFIPVYFTVLFCRAQQPPYTAFTVNNGLPSNYIYRCVEDNKGFLWIATDAGIARFDGRYFQVFTTKDGLPDNEVLNVVKENDGRIWVNCFKQMPAYFDEVQNRFINAGIDPELAKVPQSTALTYVFTLNDGGIMYSSEKGSFVFKNKKLVTSITTPVNMLYLVKQLNDGIQVRYGQVISNAKLKMHDCKLYKVQHGRLTDSLILRRGSFSDYPVHAVDGDNFYDFLPASKKFFIYSGIQAKPFTIKTDSVVIPETFFSYGFTGPWINLYAYSGRIYVINRKTLKPEFTLKGNYIPNAMYRDRHGNIWVCTIDKGLLLYRQKQIVTVTLPQVFSNSNFLSIARKPPGGLLAGNYTGEVIETKGGKIIVHSSPQKDSAIFRQRKILISQNKVFTFSENGVFADYKRQVTAKPAFVFGKTAINFNDSIIVVGGSNSLRVLNTITEKTKLLQQRTRRVTALVKAPGAGIYYGSTDGLYKYDAVNDTPLPLKRDNPLLAERITGLCTSPDSIVWVATAGSGLAVLKNDSVIFHITTQDGIISNVTRCVTPAAPGQVWLGTWDGISVINYKIKHSKIYLAVQNISANDGLSNNVVNEMIYDNDTVYAATSDGISVIPAAIFIPKFDVPVRLVRMSINQRDTVITTNYALARNQRYIQMQFAGIELNGHFKKLQYTLDRNKEWIALDENVLALQLNSGHHIVQVKAVDVNGNISNKIFTLTFDIDTPFWEANWFWLTVALMIQLVAFYLVSRWLKRKREIKLSRELAIIQTAALEQQAFTSLINPHFMFNALNSIQHYINLQDRKNANRYLSDFASLIRKNFEAVQNSFIVLEEEFENIKIYLRLEQMRFNGRFNYTIQVDENTDIDNWMIPTMMLQPFLENALLHGIMPSYKQGDIIVDVREQNSKLVLTITDNGIGIANSRARKGDSTHNSLGMELIQKRIAALNRISGKVVTMHFSDAYDDPANPGTKVVLTLDEGLYEAWLHTQKPHSRNEIR